MTPYISHQQKILDSYSQFALEYFRELTQYYQNWNVPNVNVTYYSLDIENSLIDEDKLVGGPYETVGQLSGLKWRKYLNVPFSNVEQLPANVTADEKGVTSSDKITSMRIASNTHIECHAHDFLCFTDLKDSSTYKLRNPPLFEVINVEKSPDFDVTFYKISCKISYIPMNNIDEQVDGLFNFFDYEKKLYGIDDSICMQQIIEQVQFGVCNKFFNKNTGLYMEKVNLLEQ